MDDFETLVESSILILKRNRVSFLRNNAIFLATNCGSGSVREKWRMRRLIARICVLVGLALVSVAGAQTTTSPTPTASPGKQIKAEIAEAFDIIEKNYVTDGKPNTTALFKDAVNGMLQALDPHSHYEDPDEVKDFWDQTKSQFVGIGIGRQDLVDRHGKSVATYVTYTMAGSPARNAGLLYGDKIVEIDGKPMLGKDPDRVGETLRGEKGTTATLVVDRLATGKRETVRVVRDAVQRPSVFDAYIIRPGVGYISMRTQFSGTTHIEFAEALKQLKLKGMRQLVIDLRGNVGGVADAAALVANMFLHEGDIVYSEQIRGKEQRVLGNNKDPEKAPLVLLVDIKTASASEILVGALQDHDRAMIVGQNTFGKALKQYGFEDIRGGGMLFLTTKRTHLASGRTIQRDYSKMGRYDYFLGTDELAGLGLGVEDRLATLRPADLPIFKTDTGRIIYGNSGITPDVIMKREEYSRGSFRRRAKLADASFAFSLDLAAGRVKGFEAYKIERPVEFGHTMTEKDLPISGELLSAFITFAARNFGLDGVLDDAEKREAETKLRYQLARAAFGQLSAGQVLDLDDEQIIKGIELLPEAGRLAARADKLRRPPPRTRSSKRQKARS